MWRLRAFVHASMTLLRSNLTSFSWPFEEGIARGQTSLAPNICLARQLRPTRCRAVKMRKHFVVGDIGEVLALRLHYFFHRRL